ncbi:MAG: radical SAM protein [Saprospiraceae bacterium]|nr:radical SAM protein [Saprospiraceae bacterium]
MTKFSTSLKVLLITPPFTQLNTPYPATAYLKGFLNTLGVESFQTDLSLEVALALFTSEGLTGVFEYLEENDIELSENVFRIFTQSDRYIRTIDPVIRFLQNKNNTLAHTICAGGYLPKAGRFVQSEDLDWAFGAMGTYDKARHLATLYLEDIGDLITEVIDPHFGFSRYAERLARTATHFDELYTALRTQETIITDILIRILDRHIKNAKPDVVLITAPFPGNVFAAFKCGQFIKETQPNIKVIFGGGYANTELRSIYDERVFEFIDFITLDDGEAPVQHLLEYFEGKRDKSKLKRTFCLSNGVVTYINGSDDLDIPQRETGTPDYRDLLLNDYLSVIEVINPMHRLWSDGRWNKLTLAHGCYWGKCSFCDVTLDYIKRYEPISASILCDRIEEIIAQTGQNGFHFVDEAAPPALMRDLAIEILKRDITVVWWTNIRFEKSFTPDLCRLLRASGCIAISGGLEVASDRLLDKMKKGVTVAQVARVAHAFTEAGIMVHAYLMYGFPTQTAQETIDSLEMVRQMFQEGIIQSGFWHQFAMTAHSPVGLQPAEFGVMHTGPHFGGFAENDYFHEDPDGADHELFSEGLKISLFNYMQGMGFDEPLSMWFDTETPETTVEPDYISLSLNETIPMIFRPNDIIIWMGGVVTEINQLPVKKKKNTDPSDQINYTEIHISGIEEDYTVYFETKVADWLLNLLDQATPDNDTKLRFEMMAASYKEAGLTDFESFLSSEHFEALRERGLLVV